MQQTTFGKIIPGAEYVTLHWARSAALLALVCILEIIPFWVGEFPASTDLPQHLSQLRLLEQALSGSIEGYRITPWYFPNTLVYWVLIGIWKLSDPITTGRIALTLLATGWLAATFILCRKRKRPLSNWLLASPLVFNFLFNWGLLNFLIGWPIFCMLLAVATPEDLNRRPLVISLLMALLYYAHALWFLIATIWLGLTLLGREKKLWIRVGLPLLPTWCMALYWYPKLATLRAGSGVGTGLIWGDMPAERLALDTFSQALLGSTNSTAEPLFALLLGLWIIAIVATRWGQLEATVDKHLLGTACLLILLYWALPTIYMNTIFFNQRWLPFGATLLLIALPAPNIPRIPAFLLGLFALATLSFQLTTAAKEWADTYTKGFIAAIEQVRPEDRLIGLNMMDDSISVRGRPGLQLFAYAHAIHGTQTHFDFTEHYSGAVLFDAPKPPNPQRTLVWKPTTVTKEDTAGYTVAILYTNDTLHTYFRKRLLLPPPEDTNSFWRVYRLQNRGSAVEGAPRERQRTRSSE